MWFIAALSVALCVCLYAFTGTRLGFAEGRNENTDFFRLCIPLKEPTIGNGETATEYLKYIVPDDCVIEEVQVYCQNASPIAYVDVKLDGLSVISLATNLDPGAGEVMMAPGDTDLQIGTARAGQALTVNVTTDGSGSFTGLSVLVTLAFPKRSAVDPS